jgi:hypothetical protein
MATPIESQQEMIPRTKPTKIISAKEFEAILKAAQSDPNALAVFQDDVVGIQDDFVIPRFVTHLPENVVFLDCFVACSSKLRGFNHVVHHFATFSRCVDLERIGPKTEIGVELGVAYCPNLKWFDAQVHGKCGFYDRGPGKQGSVGLESFDPGSVFGGDLDAKGTRLKSFNHSVKGFADFYLLTSLAELNSALERAFEKERVCEELRSNAYGYCNATACSHQIP